MRRLLLVVTVAVLMLAMSALPALARNEGKVDGGPPAVSGGPHSPAAVVLHCQAFEGYKGAADDHDVSGKETGNCRET